jgi:lipid A disaccharide synthetase
MTVIYKLVTNPFTNEDDIINKIDGNRIISIPMKEANTDYQEYLKWLEEGNTPLPAEEEITNGIILKVDTIQDQSGNNIINESSDTITIGASGDTITIPSGATISGALANTPAFVAYKTANQSLSNLTSTKITFTGEQLDTDSIF